MTLSFRPFVFFFDTTNERVQYSNAVHIWVPSVTSESPPPHFHSILYRQYIYRHTILILIKIMIFVVRQCVKRGDKNKTNKTSKKKITRTYSWLSPFCVVVLSCACPIFWFHFSASFTLFLHNYIIVLLYSISMSMFRFYDCLSPFSLFFTCRPCRRRSSFSCIKENNTFF